MVEIPYYLSALKYSQTLVSPAPAAGNTNWFDPFFEACEVLGCRIDYLATHDYRGDADQVMERLEMLYHRSALLCCCQTGLLEVRDSDVVVAICHRE